MARMRLYCIITLILLTSCKGKIDPNAGYVNISFDWPEVFQNFPDHIKDDSLISVYIKNMTTDESFDIDLHGRKDFIQVKALTPGAYKITGCYPYPAYLLGFEAAAPIETFEVRKGKTIDIKFEIKDMDALVRRNSLLVPTDEILNAGIFSRKLQIAGKVISFDEMRSELLFTANSEETVEPYKEAIFTNDEYRINITVLNDSGIPKAGSECKLSKITFGAGKNIVILPGGLTRALNISEIMHATKGACGTPRQLTGTLLMGVGYDRTEAHYIDEKSGDKLILVFYPNGSLGSIQYEIMIYD